jgi:hypothetical protein
MTPSETLAAGRPKPKAVRKTAHPAQNLVRQNLNKRYQQRGGYRKVNKRKSMWKRSIKEHDQELIEKSIPTFSKGFNDDSKRHETMEKPQNDEEYLKILKEKFGFDTFYDGQFEAIKSIMEGESCLSILSTGGGKSLIYQYCSLFMKGLVVIVTPLISLMSVSIS